VIGRNTREDCFEDAELSVDPEVLTILIEVIEHAAREGLFSQTFVHTGRIRPGRCCSEGSRDISTQSKAETTKDGLRPFVGSARADDTSPMVP
jgi:hypothetical protein